MHHNGRGVTVIRCARGFPAIIVLLTALTFSAGCRQERPRPPLDFTKDTSAGAPDIGTTATLSRQIGAIETAYGDIDTSVVASSDSLFSHALDSAACSLSLLVRAGSEPVSIIKAMNRCVFDQWGITFSSDRNNIRYLLPHLVWKEKKGSCVGMSLLYLLLAERAGLPLYAVRAPSHLFVRYDNGRERSNIETLRGGECMSDEWYRMRYSITDTVRYPLRNIDNGGVVAVVAYNLGTICLNERHYHHAVRFLQTAVSVLPDFPEAMGNLALAYEATGEFRMALGLLIDLRRAYPSLEQIDRTIASFQLRRGDYGNALALFDAACKKVPDDPEAHYGRAAVLIRLKRNDDAIAALDRAIKIRPGYPEAETLLTKLRR